MRDRLIYFLVGFMLGLQLCALLYDNRVFKPKVIKVIKSSHRNITISK